MGESLRLWLRLVGAQVRSQWQYRASFAIYSLAAFLSGLVDFIALAAIFGKVPQLGGWDLGEVALLYGVTGAGFALADSAVGSCDAVSRRIRDGSFDTLLLRPTGTVLQLSAEGFALRRVGKLLQALLVLGVGVHLTGVDWSPYRVLVLVGAVACSTVIYSAVFVATSAVAFWVIDGREIGNAFTYGGNFLSNQPLDIYARWLRSFATFVVPLAFGTYLPVAWVLDKPVPTPLAGWWVWLAPAVAGVAGLTAAGAWRGGVRVYRSTGS